MLSQWLDGWHHRWQLSVLIVVTEGEGSTYESEDFAVPNFHIHGERQESTWPSQQQAGRAKLSAMAGDLHMQDSSAQH